MPTSAESASPADRTPRVAAWKWKHIATRSVGFFSYHSPMGSGSRIETALACFEVNALRFDYEKPSWTPPSAKVRGYLILFDSTSMRASS